MADKFKLVTKTPWVTAQITDNQLKKMGVTVHQILDDGGVIYKTRDGVLVEANMYTSESKNLDILIPGVVGQISINGGAIGIRMNETSTYTLTITDEEGDIIPTDQYTSVSDNTSLLTGVTITNNVLQSYGLTGLDSPKITITLNSNPEIKAELHVRVIGEIGMEPELEFR